MKRTTFKAIARITRKDGTVEDVPITVTREEKRTKNSFIVSDRYSHEINLRDGDSLEIINV